MAGMRADRLLSILLLLQERGQLTAGELAAELEVSERTIYRDLDALSAAGVPVYAERGPGGGCALIDSYRTDLTGLTRDEVRALFMLSIPAPLAELGLDQDLKAAMLKLSAALPDLHRPLGAQTRQRIHLDAAPWFPVEQHTPHLRTIQRGVWENRRLKMTYRLAFDAQVNNIVEPYGLVAKSNEWYLVFHLDSDLFVRKVSEILEVELTGDSFTLPPDFNLVEFWSDWCHGYENNRPQYPIKVRMHCDLLRYLHFLRDPILQNVTEHIETDNEEWQEMTLTFETFDSARTRILGFGGAAEVLAPGALRKSVQDFAGQIIKIYRDEITPSDW